MVAAEPAARATHFPVCTMATRPFALCFRKIESELSTWADKHAQKVATSRPTFVFCVTLLSKNRDGWETLPFFLGSQTWAQTWILPNRTWILLNPPEISDLSAGSSTNTVLIPCGWQALTEYSRWWDFLPPEDYKYPQALDWWMHGWMDGWTDGWWVDDLYECLWMFIDLCWCYLNEIRPYLLTFVDGSCCLLVSRVDEAHGSWKCLTPLYLLDRCTALLVVDWLCTESVTKFNAPFNMWVIHLWK